MKSQLIKTTHDNSNHLKPATYQDSLSHEIMQQQLAVNHADEIHFDRLDNFVINYNDTFNEHNNNDNQTLDDEL